MKFLLSFITVALLSSVCLANITADEEYVLNHSGSAAQKAQLGTLVTKTRNLLVAKYSYAVQGGTSVSDISLLTNLGDKKSLAKLPNKAIIQNVWVDVLTAPTSGGSATLAVNAVNSGDLIPATAKAAFINILQGVPVGGTVAKWIKLSAEKTIKTRADIAPLTAGKFNVYIEYVIGD